MADERRLGRRFGWLWAAYGISAVGTWLAFDAFPLIAITVLHVGPGAVSAMAAAGLAAGAMVALPLGPWVEFRRKRPVMMAMDLARFVAVLSVPVAYALGRLGFGQLLVVSSVVAAADIAFTAAAGAFLKGLLAGPDLLAANARLEATTWLATTVAPPLGGAAIAVFGPVATVLANAASYLLSALGLRAVGAGEPPPARPTNSRSARRSGRGASSAAPLQPAWPAPQQAAAGGAPHGAAPPPPPRAGAQAPGGGPRRSHPPRGRGVVHVGA
ncbi:MFS transporter, partial [Frankia sp. AgKG'84/4]|uniref:MFS transporter n=1 Tax=Frankia sp. AgKG'84/4 TaxID=573490 RepID=UPI0035B228C3|nr:hypothetical protein [Frankia sp. AgKG'84/4]